MPSWSSRSCWSWRPTASRRPRTAMSSSSRCTALPALRAAAGEAFVEVDTEEIPDDWYDGWKEFHQPIVVGERVRVRPPWEPAVDDGLVDVVIDPGMAFGTGAHPTTRMCLELMLELAPGGPLADLGC